MISSLMPFSEMLVTAHICTSGASGHHSLSDLLSVVAHAGGGHLISSLMPLIWILLLVIVHCGIGKTIVLAKCSSTYASSLMPYELDAGDCASMMHECSALLHWGNRSTCQL
jgi:hypothetical protein